MEPLLTVAMLRNHVDIVDYLLGETLFYPDSSYELLRLAIDNGAYTCLYSLAVAVVFNFMKKWDKGFEKLATKDPQAQEILDTLRCFEANRNCLIKGGR